MARLNHLNYLLLISGIFIFIYFTAASYSRGRIDTFYLIVSLIGALIIILSFNINPAVLLFKKLPGIIQFAAIILFFCFVLSFLIIQILIILNARGVNTHNNDGTDYLIILGCQVNGENPSQSLSQRGLKAVSYLNNNPETKAIVTGGQGPGEDITEAEALKRILLINNINIDRILTEDKSKNTLENLSNSNDLYGLLDKKIIIVTSDYHIFRAVSIAKKLNFTNVSGLPSESQPHAIVALRIREYVSVIHNLIHKRL